MYIHRYVYIYIYVYMTVAAMQQHHPWLATRVPQALSWVCAFRHEIGGQLDADPSPTPSLGVSIPALHQPYLEPGSALNKAMSYSQYRI